MPLHPTTIAALVSVNRARSAGRFPMALLAGRNAARTRRMAEDFGRLYGHHPLMRNLAAAITAGLHGRDPEPLARRLHAWVRDNVRFLPEAGEQLQTPMTTLRRRYGDCDDHAALLAALATSVRIPVRLLLLADRQRRPFHVWAQVQLGGRWVDVETVEPSAAFGEHPAAIAARMGVAL